MVSRKATLSKATLSKATNQTSCSIMVSRKAKMMQKRKTKKTKKFNMQTSKTKVLALKKKPSF